MPTTRTHSDWKRYRLLMKWMALAALIAVVLAFIYLRTAVGEVPPGMLIATVAGVGISVLLGTGLIRLVFLSNSSGDNGGDGDHR